MSSTSAQSYRTIEHLPKEAVLYIMELCNSPDDVLGLIGAHPLSLQVFCRYRSLILRRWTGDLISRFGNLLCPSFILAARLRFDRQQPRFASLRAKAAEDILLDAAVPCISSGTPKKYRPDEIPLSTLCGLLPVGNDAEWLVANYAPYARKRLSNPDTDIFSSERIEGQLSDNERKRFLNASFHFESYCQMFFRQEELLFERNQTLRSDMFRKRMCQSAQESTGVEMFYSVLFYVYHQHWSIFRGVNTYLNMLIRQLTSQDSSEVNIAKARINAYGAQFVNYLAHLFVVGGNSRNTHKYLHYLSSQGLGKLRNLQRMNIEEQARFTLLEFFEVSRSNRPMVYIAWGPWELRAGTSGSNSWLTWQNLDDLFTDADDYEQWTGIWTSAERFWDENMDDADADADDDEMEESQDEGWGR